MKPFFPQSFVGLDIGGTAIKAMAFSPDGKALAERKLPTADDGTSSWIGRARTAFATIAEGCPEPIYAGVAAPGLPAADGHSIRFMPGRLQGLEGLNWQQELALTAPVPVLNDAQAALLGETWLGAARGCSNIILLTLGTGVGGAAMVDGRILRGHIGRAGHLGHISLNPDGPLDIVNTPGSLEDAISEHTLSNRSSGQFSSTRELVAAVRQNSAEANKVWLRSIRALAAAISGLINVLDPEVVILGGGIADAGEALLVPLQAALEQFEWRPGGARIRIARAQLGPNAGAAGAARAAQLEVETGRPVQSPLATIS